MSRRSPLAPLVLALAPLLGSTVARAAGPAGTVKGTYTIEGKTYTATHVYAVAQPDSFDKTKEGVDVIVTTQPIDEKELGDAMPGEGPRLTATIGAGGSLYGVALHYDGGSASSSGTSQIFEKKVLDGSRISGRLYSKNDIEVGSVKGRYDVTFDAPLYRVKKAPPASAADRAAAAKSPQAKAYAAYLKAIQTGDIAGLKKVVTADLLAMMDNPGFKEQLAFLKEMTPKTVDYVRLTESGDTATLEVETKTDVGTVDTAREGGVWKIGKQKWTNKK